MAAGLTPEAFKSNPEFYRFLLEERKDAREDHPSRRYLIWMTGLLIPIITGFLTFYGTELQRNETARQQSVQREETARQQAAQAAETERQRNFQREETLRKEKEEVTKRHVENARLALQMYVQNPALFDKKNPNAVYHVRMIAVISDNDELKAVFNQMWDEQFSEKVASGGTASEAAASLPDRLVAAAKENEYPNYLANVQALPESAERAQRVMAALAARKFKVPGLDTKVTQVPAGANEIRYYRPQQKDIAERLARDLQGVVNERFVAKPLTDPKLPDGVVEIWIGRGQS
jgi:hypothetical protein